MSRTSHRDFERRLDRANEHLESLEDKARVWADSHVETVIDRFNPQRGEHVITAKPKKSDPLLALLIGETLHAFRVSLDNLAYDLMTSFTPVAKLPPEAEQRCEFPIFGDQPLSAAQCKRKIGFLNPRAQTIIKGLQPHTRGQAYGSDPLWVLHRLNNVDKHRHLHVTVIKPGDLGYLPSSSGHTGGHIANKGDEALEGRTEIASYLLFDAETGERVKVDFGYRFRVAFAKGTPWADGADVLDTLHAIRDHILTCIVPPLRPFLK
jgi:hypothetical protein